MKKLEVKDDYQWPKKSENFWEKYKCEWLEDSLYYTFSPTDFSKNHLAYYEIFGKIQSIYPYYTERQYLHSYMIMYTYDGEGELLYKGQKYKICKNQIFFIDCYEYQYYKAATSGIWSAYHLHINGNIVNDYYESFVKDGRVVCDVPENSNIDSLFDEFFKKQHHIDGCTEILNNKFIVMILSELLLIKEGYYNKEKIPDYITKLQKQINCHPEKNYNLDMLSKQYGVNKYSFTKKFHKYMGASIMDYVIIVRINEAKKMLHMTDKSINQIAQEIGIEDVSYFTRLFKKKTGKTPKEYRNLWCQIK